MVRLSWNLKYMYLGKFHRQIYFKNLKIFSEGAYKGQGRSEGQKIKFARLTWNLVCRHSLSHWSRIWPKFLEKIIDYRFLGDFYGFLAKLRKIAFKWVLMVLTSPVLVNNMFQQKYFISSTHITAKYLSQYPLDTFSIIGQVVRTTKIIFLKIA